MMRFKNNNGFSLVEAMLAIAIIGMVLAPVFILETNIFNAVARLAETVQRTILSKQFIFVAYQKQAPDAKEFSLEGSEEPHKMRYSFQPVSKQSSLAKLQGLYRQQVITSGSDILGPEGRAVQFIFKPERPA